MQAQWWYSTGDTKTGPMTIDQLRQLSQDGRIHRTTLLWREGLTDWSPLTDIPELQSVLAGIPPDLPKADSRETLLAMKKSGGWRRFFARIIDLWGLSLPVTYIVAFVLAKFSLSFGLWIQRPGSEYLFGWFLLPLILLIEAGVFAMFGNTFGKFLLGIRVMQPDGEPISPRQYLRRQLGLYWYGLGTGFPLVPLFTMSRQYWRMRKGHPARYDTGLFEVKAAKMGFERAITATLVVFSLLVINGGLQEWARSRTGSYYVGKSWTNPHTANTVTLPAGWIVEKQNNDDNQPIYVFSGPDAGSMVVFAKESLSEQADLDFYLRIWRVAVADRIKFSGAGEYRQVNGRSILVIEGHLSDDLSQKVAAYLYLRGRQVWRIVVVSASGREVNAKETLKLRDVLLQSLD
jgi:uncharacterized RDD family membrane protein YckC